MRKSDAIRAKIQADIDRSIAKELPEGVDVEWYIDVVLKLINIVLLILGKYRKVPGNLKWAIGIAAHWKSIKKLIKEIIMKLIGDGKADNNS